MARNQTMFYATSQDLVPVLALMESKNNIKYTKCGMFHDDRPESYGSYADICDLGKAVHPNALGNPCYLLSAQKEAIQVQRIPQRSGGVLFAVDQRQNPDTITFRPSGRFGSDFILYGTVGTVSQSAASKALYVFAAKALRKSFTRQEEFLVGPEARELWNSGVRLTIGASSPPEFDLRRTNPAR